MSKRKATTSIPSQQQIPPNPAAVSEYKKFLNAFPIRNKKDKSIGSVIKSKWQDAPPNPQGQIVNEIAKKFNTSNPPLGITKAIYGNDPRKNSYYSVDARDKTQMDLVPQSEVGKGPDPITVGHELMHANDHQIDYLNPKVWEHLRTLAIPMADFNQFSNSIGKIQDKINPAGDFKPDLAVPNSGYPFNRAYIEEDMAKARGIPSYQTPMANGVPDWPQLFNDIQAVVSQRGPRDQIPNSGFYLNRASEFPAFMSERLTKSWKANTAPNPLSLPEARFVHSTLGDMGTAYPATDPKNGVAAYPTMNNYIGQRRGSLEAAYPGLNPQQPYSSSQSSSSGSNPIYAGIGVGGQSSSSQLSSPPSTVSSQASSVPSPHTSPSSPSTPVYYSPPSSSNLPPTYKKGGAVHSLAEHIYPFKLRHPKFSVTKGLSRYF
jgi:hypothetical protein